MNLSIDQFFEHTSVLIEKWIFVAAYSGRMKYWAEFD